MDKQNLLAEINTNRLCSNYKLYKQELGLSKYLVDLEFVDRMNLSRFICGSHRLPIAENRYLENQGPKPCSLCNTQDQADEFHYTLVCPALNNIRNMYVKKYYFTRPNSIKFNQLFNVNSKKQLSKLAKFVKIIMDQF